MDSVLYQSILFGVVTVLLGLIFSMIFEFLKPELPKECENWDKNYMMEAILFAIGFTLRMLLNNKSVSTLLYNN